MFFLYCILLYRSCKAVCIELMYTCVHRNNCRRHPSTMLSSLTTRRWLMLAVVLMVIGILLAIGGCIIASVGFGLSAIDMYDYPNLWVFFSNLYQVVCKKTNLLLKLVTHTCDDKERCSIYRILILMWYNAASLRTLLMMLWCEHDLHMYYVIPSLR